MVSNEVEVPPRSFRPLPRLLRRRHRLLHLRPIQRVAMLLLVVVDCAFEFRGTLHLACPLIQPPLPQQALLTICMVLDNNITPTKTPQWRQQLRRPCSNASPYPVGIAICTHPTTPTSTLPRSRPPLHGNTIGVPRIWTWVRTRACLLFR